MVDDLLTFSPAIGIAQTTIDDDDEEEDDE